MQTVYQLFEKVKDISVLRQHSKNLESNLENSLDQKKREHLACSVIVKKLSNQSSENENSILLSGKRGRPMEVTVGSEGLSNKYANEYLISAEAVSKISTNFGLSSNTTLGIAHSLRMATRKRKLFEPNLKEKLRASNHSLDSHFDVTKCHLLNDSNKGQENACEEDFVFCKVVQDLITHVKTSREVDDVHLKLGVDSGGGFLKITLSVQSLGCSLINTRETKRQCYSDGTVAKNLKIQE